MILERFPELLKLSEEERLMLYGELGEMITNDPDWKRMPPEVKAELDRRMEEYRQHPETARSWAQVRAKIEAGAWRK